MTISASSTSNELMSTRCIRPPPPPQPQPQPPHRRCPTDPELFLLTVGEMSCIESERDTAVFLRNNSHSKSKKSRADAAVAVAVADARAADDNDNDNDNAAANKPSPASCAGIPQSQSMCSLIELSTMAAESQATIAASTASTTASASTSTTPNTIASNQEQRDDATARTSSSSEHPLQEEEEELAQDEHEHEQLQLDEQLQQQQQLAEHDDLLPELLASIHEYAWATTLELLERDPSLAKRSVSMVIQGENSTCGLVHALCDGRKHRVPIAVLETLVTLHPAALLQPEPRGGRLPLHIAVVKRAAREVIEYLCRARPQALKHADQEGNRPLHYASMVATGDIMQMLVQADPAVGATANTRDRYALHLACTRYLDTEEERIVLPADLEGLIQAFPQALLLVDRFGRTPLHLACCQPHPQWSLLQVLIHHAPEALLMKDKARKTPYQCARKHPCDLVLSCLQECTQRERRHKVRSLPYHPSNWKVVLPRTSSSSSSSSSPVKASKRTLTFPRRRSDSSKQSDSFSEVSLPSSAIPDDEELYCCYG